MSRFKISRNQRRMPFGSVTVWNVCLAASGSIVVSVMNREVAEFIVKTMDAAHEHTEATVIAKEEKRVENYRQQARAREAQVPAL